MAYCYGQSYEQLLPGIWVIDINATIKSQKRAKKRILNKLGNEPKNKILAAYKHRKFIFDDAGGYQLILPHIGIETGSYEVSLKRITLKNPSSGRQLIFTIKQLDENKMILVRSGPNPQLAMFNTLHFTSEK